MSTTLLHFTLNSDGSFIELLIWGGLLAGALYAAFYGALTAFIILKGMIAALYEDVGDLIEWIKEKYTANRR